MTKIYRGLYDNLYKKWELYLYRLFQIARYIEPMLRFARINMPPIDEVLHPEGYDGHVRIPPNPFTLNPDDYQVFLMFMDELEIPDKENDKSLKLVLKEVWDRINGIKIWLGMTKFTRYKGEEDSNRRLINEISLYIKYPDHCDVIYRIMFDSPPEFPDGETTEEDEKKYDAEYDAYVGQLKGFKNLLLDRDVSGIKSCSIYN